MEEDVARDLPVLIDLVLQRVCFKSIRGLGQSCLASDPDVLPLPEDGFFI